MTVPMPESDRLLVVAKYSQIIGEFLSTMAAEGKRLCEWVEDDVDEFLPVPMTIEAILADYYNIDLNKVDQERQALLDHIRERNA